MARRKLFKRTDNTDLTNPAAWLLKILGGETSSGAKVTPESSLLYTGVRACVDLYSTLVASMPKGVFQNKEGSRVAMPDDPVHKLIAYTPNPYMNAHEFWELMNNYLDLWGNAYAIITWSKGVPIGLTPVHPAAMKPEIISGEVLYLADATIRGLQGTYRQKDILHFKGLTTDGLLGRSPIADAAQAIGIGLSSENFGATFFNNQGISKGVLEMDGSLDEESRNAWAKSWKNNQDHGTPLLEYGIKYKALNVPPEEAQFLQTRTFQLEDIARIFHIPPPLIGVLGDSSFSSIESLDIAFVKYGLRPKIKKFEKELEAKLFPNELGKKNILFNLDGLMRGDTATRAEYYSKMIASRVLSPNDVRKLENMNPYEGGDSYENPNTTSNNINSNEDE